MDPSLTCPSGYELNGKYCFLVPTASCDEGYTLNNNVCIASSSSSVLTRQTTPLDGNCPTGYTFSSDDNLCYPI